MNERALEKAAGKGNDSMQKTKMFSLRKAGAHYAQYTKIFNCGKETIGSNLH